MTYVNSVDPDNEASHQELRCSAFYFWFWTEPLFAAMDRSKLEDGRVQFQKLRDERIMSQATGKGGFVIYAKKK